MGGGCVHPTPIPAFPLKGKEFLRKFCNTVQVVTLSFPRGREFISPFLCHMALWYGFTPARERQARVNQPHVVSQPQLAQISNAPR